MAGSSLVLSDGSRLSRLDGHLYRVESVLALISGLAVFSLMVLAVVSVSGRNFFSQPLPGYVDWIEQAMPLIAFMGIAFAQRDGGHIRMDMIVGALRGRVLYLVEFISTLAILALMVLLVWGTWAHFARSFDFAAPMWSRDSSMDIALPLWPAKLLAPVAFSVLCARLVLQLWAFARAFIRNDDTPVAVPLVADAATQAAMEAEHVSGHDR
ncbi:TRAP transporter small permease subunit [Aliiroseovarius sp.]|uniref:TRAP transporter small permease subunit n=1 Tax=Aliiroseovarius sp. TaxID=1872442 RepID=UPI003BA99BD1